MRTFLLLLLASCYGYGSAQIAADTFRYREIPDILYLAPEAIETDSLQRLNLVLPIGVDNPPFLLWICGGAWSNYWGRAWMPLRAADCDDTEPLAFPGAAEVCDGVDNDCDGIIDNDMKYVPFGPESIRVSATDLLQAGHGGIAVAPGIVVGTAVSLTLEAGGVSTTGVEAEGDVVCGDVERT